MFYILDTKTNEIVKEFARMVDAQFYMDRNGLYDVVRYKIKTF